MVKTFSTTFTISTHGIGTYEITDRIGAIIRNSGIKTGTATVLLKHTSASLLFFENADPTARADLEEFFRRLVPEDAKYFSHTLEGSDDMPSHIRMALTRTSRSWTAHYNWGPGRVCSFTSIVVALRNGR
jgi:secondary thiamine-phosphate synthase enzyme